MVNVVRYYLRLMFLIIYGLRFLFVIDKMRQLIVVGYVGDISICEVKVYFEKIKRDQFDWMCDGIMGGGFLNEIGSDIIDVIGYLIGQKVIKVYGMLKTYIKQIEKIKGIREIISDDFCIF